MVSSQLQLLGIVCGRSAVVKQTRYPTFTYMQRIGSRPAHWAPQPLSCRHASKQTAPNMTESPKCHIRHTISSCCRSHGRSLLLGRRRRTRLPSLHSASEAAVHAAGGRCTYAIPALPLLACHPAGFLPVRCMHWRYNSAYELAAQHAGATSWSHLHQLADSGSDAARRLPHRACSARQRAAHLRRRREERMGCCPNDALDSMLLSKLPCAAL